MLIPEALLELKNSIRVFPETFPDYTCKGTQKMTSIIELAAYCSDNVRLLQYLREKNIISTTSFCEQCHVFRRQVPMRTYPDRFCWMSNLSQ